MCVWSGFEINLVDRCESWLCLVNTCHFSIHLSQFDPIGSFAIIEAISKQGLNDSFVSLYMVLLFFFFFLLPFLRRPFHVSVVNFMVRNQMSEIRLRKNRTKTKIIINQQKIKMDKFINMMMLINSRVSNENLRYMTVLCKVWIQYDVYSVSSSIFLVDNFSHDVLLLSFTFGCSFVMVIVNRRYFVYCIVVFPSFLSLILYSWQKKKLLWQIEDITCSNKNINIHLPCSPWLYRVPIAQINCVFASSSVSSSVKRGVSVTSLGTFYADSKSPDLFRSRNQTEWN